MKRTCCEQFNEICRDLAAALEQKEPADSPKVQALIRCHHQWLSKFWKPNRESYTGHAQLIVDSDLRQPYAAHHRKLPEYLAAGIKTFAARDLS